MSQTAIKENIPDTLKVHRANLDDVTNFLALQDAVSSATGHARNVQQLGAINHVVVCSINISDPDPKRHPTPKLVIIPSRRATQIPRAST